MNSSGNLLCAAAMAVALNSCLQVDHFTRDPSRFDGIYFGVAEAAPLYPTIKEQENWRVYALLGLIPWDEDRTRFAGDRLARIPATERDLKIAVTTEMTPLNYLANLGASLIPLGALLFTSRTTEVIGWRDADSGS